MAMSLEESEKEICIDKVHARRYLSFGEKILKIGPADLDII